MKKIKKIVRENKITGAVYCWGAQICHSMREGKSQRLFREKSDAVMRDVQARLEESSCSFFFAFGTLLGIIRDNKLLDRDMDIDIIVSACTEEKIQKIERILEQKGYEHEYQFHVDNIGIVQDTYSLKKIRLDINYGFSDGERDRVYLLNGEDVVVFYYSPVDTLEKYIFHGIEINVPEEPEIFLQEIYGINWRRPDPKYKYWENENAEGISEKGRVTVYRD